MRAGRFTAAIALAAATAAAQNPASPPEPPAPDLSVGGLDQDGPQAERRAQIAAALTARDYDRAEATLLAALEQEPESPDLLRLLGGVFFVRGRHLNAAIAFKKAEALAPLDERSRFTLAMAYVALGRRDWARPELRRLSEGAPENAQYAYWLARLDYEDGQYAAAVQGQLRALALDSRSVRAHDNLGLCYEALGRNEEARQSYEEAVRLNRLAPAPSAWPPLNLGILLSRLDRKEEASPLLREAVGADPNFAQGHYQLGVLLEKMDLPKEAILELEAASRLDPTYPEPHYALARLYRRGGQVERADRALERFQTLKKEKGPAGPGL